MGDDTPITKDVATSEEIRIQNQFQVNISTTVLKNDLNGFLRLSCIISDKSIEKMLDGQTIYHYMYIFNNTRQRWERLSLHVKK